MKKTIFVAFALLAWVSTSAQYITTKVVGNANGWTAFTEDPASKMVGFNDEGGLTIYNDDFTVNKTVAFNGSGSIAYLVTNDYIFLTQHLFNTDDLYELVVQTSEGEYNVYNENGELLGTIPAIRLMTIGDKTYLYKAVYLNNYINVEYTFYAIESDTNSLISVRKLESVRVFPNPANAGETIHIQLPEGTAADVDIYNISGAHELRAVGNEGTIEVPSQNLGNGVHPYKVTDDNGNTHTGKIIIK